MYWLRIFILWYNALTLSVYDSSIYESVCESIHEPHNFISYFYSMRQDVIQGCYYHSVIIIMRIKAYGYSHGDYHYQRSGGAGRES